LYSSLQRLQNFFSSIYTYDVRQRTGSTENYCKGKRNSRSGKSKETVLLFLLFFYKTSYIFWSSERYFTNVLTNFNRSGTSSNILKTWFHTPLWSYIIILFYLNLTLTQDQDRKLLPSVIKDSFITLIKEIHTQYASY